VRRDVKGLLAAPLLSTLLAACSDAPQVQLSTRVGEPAGMGAGALHHGLARLGGHLPAFFKGWLPSLHGRVRSSFAGKTGRRCRRRSFDMYSLSRFLQDNAR